MSLPEIIDRALESLEPDVDLPWTLSLLRQRQALPSGAGSPAHAALLPRQQAGRFGRGAPGSAACTDPPASGRGQNTDWMYCLPSDISTIHWLKDEY